MIGWPKHGVAASKKETAACIADRFSSISFKPMKRFIEIYVLNMISGCGNKYILIWNTMHWPSMWVP